MGYKDDVLIFFSHLQKYRVSNGSSRKTNIPKVYVRKKRASHSSKAETKKKTQGGGSKDIFYAHNFFDSICDFLFVREISK